MLLFIDLLLVDVFQVAVSYFKGRSKQFYHKA